MKKILLGIAITTFLYSLPATAVFSVEGMSCAHGCAPKINKAALEVKGVESCDVNFDDSKATIVYDNDKVTDSEILSSLQANTAFKYVFSENSKSSTKTSCSKTCSKTCSDKTKQIKKKSFFQRLFGF